MRFLIIATFLFVACSHKVTTIVVPTQAQPEIGVTMDLSGTPQTQEVAKEPEPAQVNAIYFDYNKADIRPDAEKFLWQFVTRINSELIISGHCDERGSDAYNDALGQHRADAARDWLQRHGSHGMIKTVTYGKRNPQAVDCTDDWCHQKNRRCGFEIK